MSKKISETKAEKQAVKKQPTELQDIDLDEVQGGGATDTATLTITINGANDGPTTKPDTHLRRSE